MHVSRVLETCLYVTDLDAAERFYTEVLGLEFVDRLPGRHVFLRCGSGMVLLFDPDRTQHSDSGTPTHGAHGRGHIAFAVEAEDLPAWRQRLAAHHVGIEKDEPGENGGWSIYFRDPAGNSVELATPQLWLME